VVDENGVVLKAPIKPPPGAIELSRALVAVRVAPEGPAAGKISSGDVLLSLNGRDSWKMSGYGDIRACMEELGGTESSWKPCQVDGTVYPKLALTPRQLPYAPPRVLPSWSLCSLRAAKNRADAACGGRSSSSRHEAASRPFRRFVRLAH
jgi:hypothetical protein